MTAYEYMEFFDSAPTVVVKAVRDSFCAKWGHLDLSVMEWLHIYQAYLDGWYDSRHWLASQPEKITTHYGKLQ